MVVIRQILFTAGLIVGICSVSIAETSPIADPGSRGIQWEHVQQKVAQFDWAQKIVSNLKNDVRSTRSRYDHPPIGTTGWLHEYYCSEDAHRLQFDPDKPHEHVCTFCKKVYSGPPYDDCWRSIVHGQISSAATDSAILYRITGETEWLDYAKKVLLWYAENLNQFTPHGDHAGKGWIREQSLDEAVQLVDLAQAYWDICPELTHEERTTITEKFLLPDARFIHQQTRTIHNIHSWHNAATGLVGFAVGDLELVHASIDGEFGLKNQIQKGVREDGFWFEGSITYHYYTIASMQPLYLAAKGQNYPLDGTEKFLHMYTAPVQLAFANGEFPAANDGWPGQNIKTDESYYEIASSLSNDPLIHNTLAFQCSSRERSSVDALLYGPDQVIPIDSLSHPSVLFQDSGISILRNSRINAYLKFGPYGGGHDHLDRLNLILFADHSVIIPDLGTSGYGIPITRWYRSNPAHNLLLVDGKRQARCGGYLIHYQDDRIEAGVKEAYPGVDIQRKITLLPSGIQDRVCANSSDLHAYDLIYHFRGELMDCSIPLNEGTELGKTEGYDDFKNIRQGKDQEIRMTWKLRDGSELRFRCISTESFEVFTGTCPDNPADQKLGFVLLRVNRDKMEWNTEIFLDDK